MFPSLAFYCNHETRNVMISNKKLKTGLGPNTPKSLKMRHVPKRFSLLKTLKPYHFSFISDEIINVFVDLSSNALRTVLGESLIHARVTFRDSTPY